MSFVRQGTNVSNVLYERTNHTQQFTLIFLQPKQNPNCPSLLIFKSLVGTVLSLTAKHCDKKRECVFKLLGEAIQHEAVTE